MHTQVVQAGECQFLLTIMLKNAFPFYFFPGAKKETAYFQTQNCAVISKTG